MISPLDDWTHNLSETSSLQQLEGCRVAIEASHYLQRLPKEPLLPALGGLPFSFRQAVDAELQLFRRHNIEPFFVFNGLESGSQEDELAVADKAASTANHAWEIYLQALAEDAVTKFGEISLAPFMRDLEKYLRFILFENGVAFQVAPYSAQAQLAYIARHAPELAQAIVGTSEILLYDVDKVITDFSFERGDITSVSRVNCLSFVSKDPVPPPEMFVDACMLSGTSQLPTFPLLNGPQSRKTPKVRGAWEMMNGSGRTGMSVVANYQDDPQVRALQYRDRYMRARMTVKHHIVLTKEGKAEPFDAANVPNDVHSFMGQRLPDELYYYLSRGVIGTRVLNWITTGDILELAPLDDGSSPLYRSLVRDKLTPIRSTALSLLSHALTRYYQRKDVKLICWFARDSPQTISMKDVDDPTPSLKAWNVKLPVVSERLQSLKSEGSGLLGATVRSLSDASFAPQTVVDKDTKNPLKAAEEVIYNSLGRFLQLRDYVNAKHEFTPWGEVLSTTITALKGRKDLEEAALQAIELLRLDLLSANEGIVLYADHTRGTTIDKRNITLVSRVACLGKLRHVAEGFTGPLSRHFLAYNSVITAVRSSLRDLAEVAITTLLLNGDADREALNLPSLGMELPFLLPGDCALGHAMKAYLNELTPANPNGELDLSAEKKAEVKEKAARTYFPKSVDLKEDLNSAFKLWDAVSAGVKVAGENGLVEKSVAGIWRGCGEWVEARR